MDGIKPTRRITSYWRHYQPYNNNNNNNNNNNTHVDLPPADDPMNLPRDAPVKNKEVD